MINFHNVDCLEFMKGLPNKAFDLAIVDPDFGLNGKISNGGTWAAKYKKFDGKLGGKPTPEYWDQLFRVSANQIVWGGNYFALPATRCVLVWDKVAHMDTLADFEMAWTSFDLNAKIFKHVRNSTDARIHICQKPVAIYRWLLQNYAKPGWKILDTHGGSCSHAIACDIEGFDLDICELDPDYFAAGKKRFENHLLQPRMFDAEPTPQPKQLTIE